MTDIRVSNLKKKETETIYIIDDDDEIRHFLSDVFASYGFEVHSFESPVKALAATLDEDNSCILLDFEMPEMDGLDVQKSLLTKGIRTPVILYTGKVGVDDAVNSMTAGAFTVIQKPAPNHILVNKVREAMTQSKLCQPRNQKIKDAREKLALLTERERQVADMVAEGKTSCEIGESLFISKRTVDIHRAKIFEKLEIKSIANLIQLVLIAHMER